MRMKKIILIIIFLIIISFVTAGIISVSISNKYVEVKEEEYNKAVELGIDKYQTEDYNLSDGTYKREFMTNVDFNIPPCYGKNTDKLDECENELLSNILKRQIIRGSEIIEPILIGQGNSTLKKR